MIGLSCIGYVSQVKKESESGEEVILCNLDALNDAEI